MTSSTASTLRRLQAIVKDVKGVKDI